MLQKDKQLQIGLSYSNIEHCPLSALLSTLSILSCILRTRASRSGF